MSDFYLTTVAKIVVSLLSKKCHFDNFIVNKCLQRMTIVVN